MTAPGVTALVVSAGVLVVLAALGWHVASKKQTSDVAPDVPKTLQALQDRHQQDRELKTEKNQLESSATREATVRPAMKRTRENPDPECGGDYGDGTAYCANHTPNDYQTCREACASAGEPFVPLPFR